MPPKKKGKGKKTTKTRLNITDQELAQEHVHYEKMRRDKEVHIKIILTRLNEEKQQWNTKLDTIFDENKRSLRNLNLIHLEVSTYLLL